MKIVSETNLIGTRRVLRFSKAEQAALRRAEKIADDARALMRQIVGEEDAEMHSLDTELAHIAIGVDETVDGVELDFEHLTAEQMVGMFSTEVSSSLRA